VTDPAKAVLIEKTKEFVKQHDTGLLACPKFGCRFVSRDPEAVCPNDGEKVR
jgi:hypothetical protein